ncbi:MAG: TonB-dependent receptor plug domain-containing protein [Ignavibacteriaceae bacterium]|nr:TonB-dependent receptor plug domain-containing protein [Ignavibacteriaceae bacterium]
MKQKFFIAIVAVLVMFSDGISQQKKPTNTPGGADPSGEISGVLIDSKSGKPVEYGNFVIYRKKDNALVNGTVSDVTGAFKLSAVPYGFYTAEITFIGYDKVVVDSIMVTPKSISVNLGTIKINPSGLTTDEVLVTGEKDGIINNLDKIVINVDKNIASAGGNAADVLRNVPAVTVDIDGNLTLRGNGNVKILIDGRPANTGGQSIGDILASIPAGSIESIELVTNPSAKYDAEGTAGIVNIKLKKKSNLGINGMISSNVGTNDKYNSSVNLNYKLEHVNFFGNFDFRINNFMNDGNSTRFASYPGFTNSLNQVSTGNFTMNMSNYNLGFDYFLDDFNTLTLQGNYRKFEFNNAFKSQNTSISSNSPTEFYERYSEGARDFQNQNYSLNYKRSFLDKNTELTADVTYSRNDVNLGSFANI